jgi:hypothetical protein
MGSPVVHQLKKAMRNLSSIQQRMAWILYRVNGIENAMEFVEAIKEKGHGLTPTQSKA